MIGQAEAAEIVRHADPLAKCRVEPGRHHRHRLITTPFVVLLWWPGHKGAAVVPGDTPEQAAHKAPASADSA